MRQLPEEARVKVRGERKTHLGGKTDPSLMTGGLLLSLNLEDRRELLVLCTVLVAFQG